MTDWRMKDVEDAAAAALLTRRRARPLDTAATAPLAGTHLSAAAELATLRSINARLLREIAALKEREAHALRLADRDGLTGLYNRRRMSDLITAAIGEAARGGQRLGVLFIDLDGFKEVNDVHGHDVGDELLIRVSDRLRREVRDGDTVARFGGDEFVVLCEDLVRIEAAEPLARRLAEAVAQPVSIAERLLVVHASIGVVVEQNSATSAEALVKRADAEMYRVKHGAR